MKALNHLGIMVVRENVRDQGSALFRSERAINQWLPWWNAAAMQKPGQDDTPVIAELKHTSRMKLSVRVDARGLPDSNIVVSVPTFRRLKWGGSVVVDARRAGPQIWLREMIFH